MGWQSVCAQNNELSKPYFELYAWSQMRKGPSKNHAKEFKVNRSALSLIDGISSDSSGSL